MRTELSFIFLAGMMTVTGSAWAVDYTVPGPVAFTTTDFANGTAGTLGGKLVVPNAPGKYPLLVNTHGFSGNASQQLGWAEHYASYGFIAVVPSIGGADHKANGDVLVALTRFYIDPATVSPAQGKVDATRIGLSGHSAGGLQTTLAAAQLKPRATVLLDPVDNAALGKTAYATLCSPVLGIFAEPGACNNQSDWTAFKTMSAGPQVLLNIVGANHCDPINPSIGALCDIACGGTATPGHQATISQYSTAYFLAMLKDDAAAAASITATVLTADTALRDTSVKDAPNCAITPDDGGVSADVTIPPDSTPPRDGSSDGVGNDVTPTSDTRNETTNPIDAPRFDATVDAVRPPTDAPSTADVAIPPTSEPPASDAGSTVPDSSVPPVVDSGSTGTSGTPGTTTPTSEASCSCTLAANESQRPWGAVASLLFGFVTMGRRLRKRATTG